jgi:Fic family protein
LEWVEEQLEAGRSISEEFIRELHSIIVVRGRGRRGSRSSYRQDECPVVDAATNTIDYGPPRPEDVPPLMEQMIAWLRTAAAKELPGPVRSGLLAHRFVSIHPFNDGNGRTARALATAELWRSGYDMRGFLSLEEHYMADLNAYYDNLQMGLPVDFYQGGMILIIPLGWSSFFKPWPLPRMRYEPKPPVSTHPPGGVLRLGRRCIGCSSNC